MGQGNPPAPALTAPREWWVCPECCAVWTPDQRMEFADGHYDPYDYNLPSCQGMPVRVREVIDGG